MCIKTWLTVGCLAMTSTLWSQTTHQQAYWIRFYSRHRISSKWSWHLELDERRLMLPDRQLQFITHAHVHRALSSHWEGAIGASYSLVNRLNEWRLFQELHGKKNLGKRWQMSCRLRTEQRWMEQADTRRELLLRGRIRAQIDYCLSKKWKIKGSNEWMWQAGDFDQNRLYGALEWQTNNSIALEIGFLSLYQKRSDTSYFDRSTLRGTIYWIW
jgi:Protein of unknown function (DUF2490)